MSLLFNMLSRLVIAFLPRSKSLLISWLQSPSAVILEPKKIKPLTVFSVLPSICHEVMGPDAMILVFWMLSFKPTFSLSSFTSSRGSLVLCYLPCMVSSAYLRLMIFLPEILIPACVSSLPLNVLQLLQCLLYIILPFLKCYISGIMWYVAFSDCLLVISNLNFKVHPCLFVA